MFLLCSTEEPNNSHGNEENCVHTYDSSIWNDFPCTTYQGFACKLRCK